MKIKFISVAILGALLGSSSLNAATYYSILGEKSSGQFIVGNSALVPDNNGGNNGGSNPDTNAGEDKEVPSSGYDYDTFQVGTYSSYLRNNNQETLFGSNNILTHTFIYDVNNGSLSISGDATGTSENLAMYLNSSGYKLSYNPSTFQLTVSALDSITPSLNIPASKSANILSASVADAVTISYNSGSDAINLNGSTAIGTRTFDSNIGLYMDYNGDANNGSFSFSSPSDLSYGSHNGVQYTSSKYRVDFNNNEYIEYNNGSGFVVSDGTNSPTTSNYSYVTSGAFEGFYEIDTSTKQISYSAPHNFQAGSYKSQIVGGTYYSFLKLDASNYITLSYKTFPSPELTTNANDSSYDCLDPNSCNIGGLNVTFDSGSNSFIIN